MEQKDLNSLGKNELMEHIKTKRADEMKSLKGLGSIFLIILVYHLIDYFLAKDSEMKYWLFPAFMVLWSIMEVWWKTRMCKCDDAKQMVSLHDNYYKYLKAEYIIALVLFIPLSYLLFRGHDTIPLGLLIFLAVLWIALFCWILWRLIKLLKSCCDPEIERLRELVN